VVEAEVEAEVEVEVEVESFPNLLPTFFLASLFSACSA